MNWPCEDKIAGMVGNKKKGKKWRGELLTQPKQIKSVSLKSKALSKKLPLLTTKHVLNEIKDLTSDRTG